MKTKYLAIFLFGFFAILCCAKNNEWQGTKETRDGVTYIRNPETGLWRDSKKLILKEVLSIGIEEGDEDYVFASIKDVEVDRSGNIYVCDFKDDCIKVYDQTGHFLKKFGSRGSGPGELFGPWKISINQDNEIFISEAGTRRISIFTLEGIFQKSFKVPLSVFDMTCLKNGEAIVSAMINDSPFSADKNIQNLYHIYTSTGQLISSFGKPIIQLEHVQPKQYSVVYMNFFDNYLICIPNYPYRIEWYNEEYNLEKVVTRECTFLTAPELIMENEYMPIYSSRGILGRIFFFPDGKFLVTLLDLGENYKDNLLSEIKKQQFNFPEEIKLYYDFYDKNGHFLQSFSIDPNYGSIIFIDEQGFVYTKSGADEIPMLRKFEISFEDK